MKIKYLFIVLIYSICSVFAGQFQDLIERGNEAFKNSEYEKAIEIYNKIIDQNVESAEVYNNIGDANFRLGRIGSAILYFEKALKMAQDDEDINYNLQIVNARTVDRINELPEVWIVDLWNSIVVSLSIYSWSAIVILAYLAFLTVIGLYVLTRNFKLRKISFFTGSALFPVLIIVTIMFIAKIDRETSSEYGILIENTIAVKLSPDEKSDDAFVIHEGLKFAIEDSFSNWAKIKLADGKIGWIPLSAFERI
jgi:tetratricopeptide (TPR) repeat protein